MTELQMGGLIILLAAALPCYLLAMYIEKTFALVMAFGCVLTVLGLFGTTLFIGFVTVLPLIPLVYCALKAKRDYGK